MNNEKEKRVLEEGGQLTPLHSDSNTNILPDTEEKVKALSQQIEKLKGDIEKIKTIQTPFELILHKPLIFVSVIFRTLIIVGYFTHRYMNKIDMDYSHLRQEFKDELSRQKIGYNPLR